MLTMIIVPGIDHYKPHKQNIKVAAKNGNDLQVIGIVAWWSDNPIKDAIKEAKETVRLYKAYNIHVTRIVLDGNNNDAVLFNTDLI